MSGKPKGLRQQRSDVVVSPRRPTAEASHDLGRNITLLITSPGQKALLTRKSFSMVRYLEGHLLVRRKGTTPYNHPCEADSEKIRGMEIGTIAFILSTRSKRHPFILPLPKTPYIFQPASVTSVINLFV